MTALSSRAVRSRHPGLRHRIDLAAWWGLYRQRKQLGALDARMLDDIGCSSADAQTEATRPVWDVPSHWRK